MEERCTGEKKLLGKKLWWHLYISTEKRPTCPSSTTLKFMRSCYQPRKPIRTHHYHHQVEQARHSLSPSLPVVYCIWKIIQSESCTFSQIVNLQLLWLTFFPWDGRYPEQNVSSKFYFYYANSGQEVLVLVGVLISRWKVC